MSVFHQIQDLLNFSERRKAVVLLVFMIISMILETLGIGLIVPTIGILTHDNLAESYPVLSSIINWLGNPSRKILITIMMLSLVGIYLVKNLFLAFLVWRQTRFVFSVQTGISQRLFTTYLHQPYTFHLQRNSAQLIRNITGEVAQFTNTLTSAMNLIAESLVLLGITSLLIFVEPLGALIVVLVIGIASFSFYRIIRTYLSRWGQTRQLHDGLRIQHLQEGLGGIKDVKLLGRESDFLMQYKFHNSQSVRMSQLHITVQQFPRLGIELLGVVSLSALVLTLLVQGANMASIVPTLGLFAGAAFRLMPSANRILSSLQIMRYGLPVIDNLSEEIKLAVPEQSPQNTQNIRSFQKDICLSDINYTYSGAAIAALSGISLNINKGELVGFIGPSGSGKSTLVDVILGLLTPNAGEVVVDNQDIQQNLRGWQGQIGYVPQSIYLTDDTLKRNIAFAIPAEQIDDDAVQRAIKSAQLEEFVKSLPDGVETFVGERGIRLSGGQRQRIGIARALYHDPDILVLDEATSSLDTATELGVMQTVTKLQGSKTILIVAHRLSTVEHCNRLYRLEQGNLIAEGTPAEILRAV